MGIIEDLILPSPVHVARTFISGFPALMDNARITLTEIAMGLGFGIAAGFFAAVLMDRFKQAYKAFYPLIILIQTVPAMAMAPLLILRFGYETTPKVILTVTTTFLPITAGLLTGFKSADPDTMNLLRVMGVGRMQIFRYLKPPGALNQFFSSLRISVSCAAVGIVISEWLGGFDGLGVYMTRVRKTFSFDRMFVVIFLIPTIDLLLIWLVEPLQEKCMPWGRR